MNWMTAVTAVLAAAKAAAPAFQDIVNAAEAVGADVSAHKPIAQDFADAVAGLEKALSDATGIL